MRKLRKGQQLVPDMWHMQSKTSKNIGRGRYLRAIADGSAPDSWEKELKAHGGFVHRVGGEIVDSVKIRREKAEAENAKKGKGKMRVHKKDDPDAFNHHMQKSKRGPKPKGGR